MISSAKRNQQRPARHAALELRSAATGAAPLDAAITELKHAPDFSPELFISAAQLAVANVERAEALDLLLTHLAPELAPYFNGDTSRSLATLIEARDPNVGAHHRAVEAAAGNLCRAIGVDHSATTRILRAARVFDVGKLFVPLDVLYAEGPLDRETWPLVQRHVLDSAAIVEPIGSLAPLVSIVLAHHERIDGHGYPNSLYGNWIPGEAKVLAIADAWVSLVSPRSYRCAVPIREALLIMEDGKGQQWDAGMVDALLAAVTPIKSGSRQRLSFGYDAITR